MINPYDEVPYKSYSFPESHPNRLYTIAKLFKMRPIDISKARILDLGCGSGGNIIPLAYSFPNSSFLGIDLSQKAVSKGNQQLCKLNLTNINLKHASILDVDKNYGKFDYIICHGVYSWVDDKTRDKIMDICCRNLSPQEVAYVSYNIFPGWNVTRSLRELMLYHTKNIKSAKEKLHYSKEILKFLGDIMKKQNTVYAKLLLAEIDWIINAKNYHLYHDHLGEKNHIIYFHEFIEHATKHNLQFLSEAFLPSMNLQDLKPACLDIPTKYQKLIKGEQLKDFMTNRSFRATLLCHDTCKLNRNIQPQDIKNFLLSSHVTCKKKYTTEELNDNTPITFTAPITKIALTCTNPLIKNILDVLRNPDIKAISYHHLIEKIKEKIATKNNNEIDRFLLTPELVNWIFTNIIELNSFDLPYTTNISKQPKISSLAVEQLTNQHFVTNQLHNVIKIDPITKEFIQLLDGNQVDMETINNKMTDAVVSKKLNLSINGKKNASREEIRKVMPIITQTILKKLARDALLIG